MKRAGGPLPDATASHATRGSPYAAWETKIGHVNEKIKSYMAPYLTKFGGKLCLNQICRAANVQRKDLPRLNEFTTPEGTNKLCYSNILAVCPMGDRCSEAASHRAVAPDDFAAALIAALEPGIKSVLASGQEARRKRVKRE